MSKVTAVLIGVSVLLADQVTKIAVMFNVPRWEAAAGGWVMHSVGSNSAIDGIVPMALFLCLLAGIGWFTRWNKWAVVMVFGGLSNAADVVIDGRVIDWLVLGPVVTNAADIAIAVGVVGLVVTAVRNKKGAEL